MTHQCPKATIRSKKGNNNITIRGMINTSVYFNYKNIIIKCLFSFTVSSNEEALYVNTYFIPLLFMHLCSWVWRWMLMTQKQETKWKQNIVKQERSTKNTNSVGYLWTSLVQIVTRKISFESVKFEVFIPLKKIIIATASNEWFWNSIL